MMETLKGYMPKEEAERIAELLHGRFELSSYPIDGGEDVVVYVNPIDMMECFSRNGWAKEYNPENLPVPQWGDYGIYVQFDRYLDAQTEAVHMRDGSLRAELFGHFAERVGIDLASIE